MSDKVYTSSFSGAQIDEAVDKVINGDIEGSNIKEGSIPLSALADDAKNIPNLGIVIRSLNFTLSEEETERTLKVLHLYKGNLIKISFSYDDGELIIDGDHIFFIDNSLDSYNDFILNCLDLNMYIGVSTEGLSTYRTIIEEISHPTPDWNAQVGEAGYIENKPFSIDYITISDNPVISNMSTAGFENSETYEVSAQYASYMNIIGLCYEHNGYNGMVYVPIKYGEITTFYQTLYNKGISYQITIKIDAAYGPTGVRQIKVKSGSKITKIIGVAGFNKIDEKFIPNTVLKTTPQTLSNTDKNQALANLGIDPVVWKYMCEPYVINEAEPQGSIPEELIPIIFDIDGNLRGIVQKLIVLNSGPIHNWDGNKLYGANDYGISIGTDGNWERTDLN